jgi:alkylated DNA repair protein alkB family protein 6
MASDASMVQLPASLEHARIPGLPPAAFYIPNFITAGEERAVLDKVRPAQ